VFSTSPRSRAVCPGFDAIVLAHGAATSATSTAIQPADASAAVPRSFGRDGVQCAHRRESIAEMDAIIPGSAEYAERA
jgi:hypothetical protein